MAHAAYSTLATDEANVLDLLERIAASERGNGAPSYDDALMTTRLMAAAKGRAALFEAFGRRDFSGEPALYLTYIRAVVYAKHGHIDGALATVRAARGRATDKVGHRWLDQVLAIIDRIAVETKAEESDDRTLAIERNSLLEQGKLSEHIAHCRNRFHKAKTLVGKLKAIRSMLGTARRPIPDYRPAFAAARECYLSIAPEISRLAAPLHSMVRAGSKEPFASLSAGRGLLNAWPLISALDIAAKIGLREEVAQLAQGLYALASHPLGYVVRWPIVANLIKADYDRWVEPSRQLVTTHLYRPLSALDVRFCFEWAARCGEYDLAEDVHNRLPRRLKGKVGYAAFATILQRQGRFAEAYAFLAHHAADFLSDTGRTDAQEHWKAVIHLGQLDFSARAANLLSEIPQPSNPKGVLFVLPMTANLSTLLPITVLQEAKRRSWAIIPLVEGIFPLERTGRPEIDRFLGCIRATGQLRSDICAGRKQDVLVDIPHGHLRIDGLTFDQALWEEAAIKQRRYRVEYGCPTLQAYLRKQTTWAVSTATVLPQIHKALEAIGLPAGTLVTFQARIPDAIVHAWCAKHGDPQRFFCAQGSNGYQNYFANFSEPVSSRMAIRNMTAAGPLRSPSFPTPQEFDDYYTRFRAQAPDILERVQDITRLRRSRRIGSKHPIEAEALVQRVRAWRAAGGKVACAFGKVVCDSGVPIDGGPAHRSMYDWINHTVASVAGSKTLLLVKPHPHEHRNEIGAYLTETFAQLIDVPPTENVYILGHDWFDMADLMNLIDIGLVYNGTSTIELGLHGKPAILCSDYAVLDYPIGQAAPRDRAHYERLVRFEEALDVAPDLSMRAAVWLHYLSGNERIKTYRYHARPITNRSIYPPWWFEEDLTALKLQGDPAVGQLTDEITGPSA
ncbi:hypothetical protein [Shinella sp. M31]|uniref:hypothetical protein n=1 Tax=Shinella sp. M31 TaxID=3368615 RepID=UPI003BA2EF9F